MLSIRCSRLPLVTLCPQAARAPAFDLDSSSAIARLGTACHEILGDRILGHQSWKAIGPGFSDMVEVAERFGVEIDELRPLASVTLKLWERVKGYFPDPQVEQRMELRDDGRGLELTGHVDVLSLVPAEDEIRILDLKTGRIDSDPRAQLRGYGALALKHYVARKVYACQLRPRDGVLEGWRWTREELEDWYARLADSVTVNPAYHVGRQCTHCPRWAECQAAKEYTRGVIEHLGALEYGGALTGEQAIDLYGAVKHAEAVAEMGRTVLRASVADAGGAIWHEESGLVLRQTKTARILWDAGETILRERLGERLAEAVDVSKTKAEKIVRDAAGKGMKGRAAEALMAELKDAGAVVYDEGERLEPKRRASKESEVANVE